MKPESIATLREAVQGKTADADGFIEDIRREVEIFSERRRYSREVDFLESRAAQRVVLEKISRKTKELADDIAELSPALCEATFHHLWDWRQKLEELTAKKKDEYGAMASSDYRVAMLQIRDRLVDAMNDVSEGALQLKAQLAPYQHKVISDRDYLLLNVAKIYHRHSGLKPTSSSEKSTYYTIATTILEELGEAVITDRQFRNIIKRYWKPTL